MSARMPIESLAWTNAQPSFEKNSTEIQVESLFRNFEEKNLVAPLRQMQAGRRVNPKTASSDKERQAALTLQEHWESCLVRRELLRNEIKRGREFLEHVQKDLVDLRAKLEEWPAFERICGHNPVLDYMASISANERVEAFLPAWIKRRESELQQLTRDMQACARKNNLEHLL